MALLEQRILELAEVLDDPVEDDRDLVLDAARERVRVLEGDLAVRRPARVADPGHRGGAVEARRRLQLVEVADRADVVEALVLEQRDAGRVIAAVLEPLETLEEQRVRLPGAHVSDDSAHLEPPFFKRPVRPSPGLFAHPSAFVFSAKTRLKTKRPGFSRALARRESRSYHRGFRRLPPFPLRRVPARQAPCRRVEPRLAAPAARRSISSLTASGTSFARTWTFAFAWGSLVIWPASSRSVRPLSRRAPAEQERADEAVPGRVSFEIHDVPGLLAAELPALAAKRLEDVAVADGCRQDADAALLHEPVEAEVRHLRDGHGVDAEVEGDHGEDLVAVELPRPRRPRRACGRRPRRRRLPARSRRLARSRRGGPGRWRRSRR